MRKRTWIIRAWVLGAFLCLTVTAWAQDSPALAGSVPSLCPYLPHNTITVESPDEVIDRDTGQTFGEAVRAALSKICPCYMISLGTDGAVLLQSPVDDREAFCECYCEHLAGCNLVESLSSNPAETKIRRSRTGNRHIRLKVKWNPTLDRGGKNAEGSKRRPPSVGLAHELIHALHTINGTRGTTKDAEEAQTARDENQIRDELDEPQRTHRGRRRVINPGGGTLDTTDRADCGCGGD